MLLLNLWNRLEQHFLLLFFQFLFSVILAFVLSSDHVALKWLSHVLFPFFFCRVDRCVAVRLAVDKRENTHSECDNRITLVSISNVDRKFTQKKLKKTTFFRKTNVYFHASCVHIHIDKKLACVVLEASRSSQMAMTWELKNEWSSKRTSLFFFHLYLRETTTMMTSRKNSNKFHIECIFCFCLVVVRLWLAVYVYRPSHNRARYLPNFNFFSRHRLLIKGGKKRAFFLRSFQYWRIASDVLLGTIQILFRACCVDISAN